jgi:hypothetical protein
MKSVTGLRARAAFRRGEHRDVVALSIQQLQPHRGVAFDAPHRRLQVLPRQGLVERGSHDRAPRRKGIHGEDKVSFHLYWPVDHIGLVAVAPEIESPHFGLIWSADRAGSMLSGFLDAVGAEVAAGPRR